MPGRMPLSALAAIIQETMDMVFRDADFWIVAEITDVKKYDQKRWCFLKFIEKKKGDVVTEFQGVFWSNAYHEILRFERLSGQTFASGIEISCRVAVRFHPRYGLKLEVREIDAGFTLGQMELEKQQTLEMLLQQYPTQIQLIDGEYSSPNNRLAWPLVIQRIALIAAPDSDGRRDFLKELLENPYGYAFRVTEFPAGVQGKQAAGEILRQLQQIQEIAHRFDAVAIVRGGGSLTDLMAFDDAELAAAIALMPIPVCTGIGHDRNKSIADLMGHSFKTPTKVAAAMVDTNLRFESSLQMLNDRIRQQWDTVFSEKSARLQSWEERIQWLVPFRIQRRRERLSDWEQMAQKAGKNRISHLQEKLVARQKSLDLLPALRVKAYKTQLRQMAQWMDQMSPQKLLNRGFAMVMQNDQIITDAARLHPELPMKTILKQHAIISTIRSLQPESNPFTEEASPEQGETPA